MYKNCNTHNYVINITAIIAEAKSVEILICTRDATSKLSNFRSKVNFYEIALILYSEYLYSI